jgi:hypothetical protein
LTICIPEIVIDEVVNGYRTDINSLISSLRKLTPDIENLLRPVPGLPSSPENEIKLFREALLNNLGSSRILPYPSPDLKAVVGRALLFKKPFRPRIIDQSVDQKRKKGNSEAEEPPEDEVGYRDALLWETIKELLKTESGHVYFVTQNSRDFGSGEIHSDLAEELRDASIDIERLDLISNLGQFLNIYRRKNVIILNSPDDLRHHLQIDVGEDLTPLIDSALKAYSWWQVDPKPGVSDVDVEEISDIVDIEPLVIRPATDDKSYVLTISATVRASFTGLISYEDLVAYNDGTLTDENPTASGDLRRVRFFLQFGINAYCLIAEDRRSITRVDIFSISFRNSIW